MLRLILAASVIEPVTAFSIAAVTFSDPACRSAARSLAVLALCLTKSRAASGTCRLFSASVTGAKAFLMLSNGELNSVVMVHSILRFELWARPVHHGPERTEYATSYGAMQYLLCNAT